MTDTEEYFNLYKRTSRKARELLSPSILTVVVVTIASVTAMTATLYVTQFSGTQEESYTRLAVQGIKAPELPAQIKAINESINQSETAANAAVFMVWVIAGLLLYSIISAIAHGIKVSGGVVESVWFSPKDGKHRVVEEVSARLGVRLLGVLGLYMVYGLTMKIMPYAFWWLTSIQYSGSVLMSIVASLVLGVSAALTVYVCAILLRAVVLRTRVFF